MTRKNERMNVAFYFYECPICHQTGSLGFRTDAKEDQHFTTACEHAIPITVEGSDARARRVALDVQASRAAYEAQRKAYPFAPGERGDTGMVDGEDIPF